jgi:hypothetical protein
MKAFLLRITSHIKLDSVETWPNVTYLVHADTFEQAEEKARKHISNEGYETVLRVVNLTIE